MSVETFLKAHRDRVSPECILRPSPTCALCRNPTDHLVQASEDWCTALWVAEKHITQRVQPLVRSPILTSYARGAYHLRQKPCGWCCTSCCDWVRKQSEAQQLLVEPSWGPIPGVWPQLGEAAITGARFFPVDFEKKTPGHDESANMGIPLPLGTQVTSSSDRTWNTSWKGRGPQSKRRPARKKHRKPEESGDPSSQQGSFSKSSRRPARKQPSEPTGDPLVKAEEGSDTHSSPGLAKELSQRADTCPRVALRSLLQTPPASDLQSKEAQLLQWVESQEDALVEGTLGHWVAYRIMTCLESREEDTIGILAAVEEVVLQQRRPTGAHEFVLLQANVTTYTDRRSNSGSWRKLGGQHVSKKLMLLQPTSKSSKMDSLRGPARHG